MTKASRFFRWVWRVNALLILVATAATVFGVGMLLSAEFGARTARQQLAAGGPVVAAGQSGSDLVLGPAALVPGTRVMRAELNLHRGGEGFSSGGYSETRNMLFIEPGERAARWLLPDHQHVITENSDVTRQEGQPAVTTTIATVALVKQRDTTSAAAGGRLLLFDPPARRIQQIANGVRTVHAATLSGQDLIVLYEQDRQLRLATFDPDSLQKRNEAQIGVPVLK